MLGDWRLQAPRRAIPSERFPARWAEAREALLEGPEWRTVGLEKPRAPSQRERLNWCLVIGDWRLRPPRRVVQPEQLPAPPEWPVWLWRSPWIHVWGPQGWTWPR